MAGMQVVISLAAVYCYSRMLMSIHCVLVDLQTSGSHSLMTTILSIVFLM